MGMENGPYSPVRERTVFADSFLQLKVVQFAGRMLIQNWAHAVEAGPPNQEIRFLSFGTGPKTGAWSGTGMIWVYRRILASYCCRARHLIHRGHLLTAQRPDCFSQYLLCVRTSVAAAIDTQIENGSERKMSGAGRVTTAIIASPWDGCPHRVMRER